MKIFILIGGLALRFCWVMLRGLSRDELTSIGYVLEPHFDSVFWDNSPPTFYLAMKALWALSANEEVLRFAAFCVSAVSFVVFFRFLDREEKNLWLLGFWALSPTSVINATFRPTVLAELAGILFFIALRSGRWWKIVLSMGALVGSTFVAFLAPIVAMSEIDFRDRKKIGVLAVGSFVALVSVSRIDWRALGWLGSESHFELLKSSALALSQLWGFSLPLVLAVAWTLIRHRAVPRYFIVIVALIIMGPLVTGHQFASSRFFIVLTPWVLATIAVVLRLRRELAVGAVIVLVPAVTTFWFLMHEKSGWREAGRFVASTGENAVFFAPPSLARQFSNAFLAASSDLTDGVSRVGNAGWIVRANPNRDHGMNEFLAKRGNDEYALIDVRVFGADSLEPVRVVRVARRPVR